MRQAALLAVVFVGIACRSPVAKNQPAKSRPGSDVSLAPQERTREAEFWRWFKANDARLFEFERDQERVFDDLGDALHRVHPDLTFEFGPRDQNRRDFVVSAGGIRDAFPAVKGLVAVAPSLAHWNIKAFRPRREVSIDIKLNGVSVHASQVKFLAGADGNLIAIKLLIPNYRPTANKTFEQIGYLLLDEALGELAVETLIGGIGFGPLTGDAEKEAQPLKVLAKTVDDWSTTHPMP